MARIRFGLAAALLFAAGTAQAQYSRVETPFQSMGHSFYENLGASWALEGNGWFARFGAQGATPPFGGFDPNAQGQVGFGFRGGGVSGSLNFTAGQGSDTFLGGQSASVVVPNGGMGFISDTIQRPFVMGYVPVVGSAEPVSPVKQALSRLRDGDTGRGESRPRAAASTQSAIRNAQSTAERGDLSIAEIRALQAAEDAQQAAAVEPLIERATACEGEGKLGLARIYYRQALRHATGGREAEINAKIRTLNEQLRKPADE